MSTPQNRESFYGTCPFDDERFRSLWEQSWDGSLRFNDNDNCRSYELRVEGGVRHTLIENDIAIAKSPSQALRILALLIAAKLAHVQRRPYLLHDEVFQGTWGRLDWPSNRTTRRNRVDQAIVVLRAMLRDKPQKKPKRESRIIGTVPGHGYCFFLDPQRSESKRDDSHVWPERSDVVPARQDAAVLPSGYGASLLLDHPDGGIPSNARFEYLGKSIDALRELIKMIPHARRIEDTTVRWNIAPSLYTDMQDYVEALRNSDAKFRSITGPVQDDAHVQALREVYGKKPGDKERPSGQIKCFRLHHAAALMNFVLVYPKNRPLPAVLFGYGTQRQDLRDEQTPVFRSTDDRLVKEFQRLFNELRTLQFSREISVDDPDFVVSHADKSDVVATFNTFPGTEIMDRIKACRKRIAICTTAWSAFDSFTRELQRALENGCSIEIALWKDNSPFAEARGKEVGGNNDLRLTIAQNKLILEALEGHPKFRGRWCNGWGSVTIFWIDDLIYFSPYWSGMRSSGGTHFLVHAKSPTGKHLQRQYRIMLPPEEASGVVHNLSTER